VTDRHLRFALREVRRHYSNKNVLVALLGIGVILGISGPFGTSGFMRMGPLIAYWVVISFTTFAAGTFVGAWSSDFCKSRNLGHVLSISLNSIGTGAVTVLIVVAVNWAALGLSPATPGYLGPLIATTFVTAAIIATILFFSGVGGRTASGAVDGPRRARILDRLPLDKRGALVSMSVSDHYVEVVTDKGQELILIRLADAMAETEGVRGAQVHRSHWVALDQVTAARRQGDRAILTMSDGRDIPVSRSYVPVIKDAGLLPR